MSYPNTLIGQQRPSKASRLMHKFSSRSLSSRSSSSVRGSKATLEESLVAIRGTLWPRPNLAKFTEILDASPGLVKMVYGEKGETLLHRWAHSFCIRLQT